MFGDSKNSESPTIERVFELLDKWRHLPTYQLERRADIFFALFLPEVLGVRFDMKINPLLVPEFPIKKEEDNRSTKADYLALQKSEDGGPVKQAFLVELKTDMASLTSSKGQNQRNLLKEAANKGIGKIICGIKEIAMSKSVTKCPQTRAKYFHLLHDLKKLDLINIPNIDCLKKLLPSGKFSTDNYKSYVKNIEIRKCPKLKVVYIIPEGPRDAKNEGSMHGIHQIPFEEFIKYAKNRGAIGSRFAKSLECWKKQAGSCPPQL